VLFLLSLCIVFLTLIALWQRRAAIRANGFNASWAAVTFPSCSSAVAALQYSGQGNNNNLDGGGDGGDDDNDDPAAPSVPSWLTTLLRVYSVTFACLVLVVVICVASGCVALVFVPSSSSSSSSSSCYVCDEEHRHRRPQSEETVVVLDSRQRHVIMQVEQPQQRQELAEKELQLSDITPLIHTEELGQVRDMPPPPGRSPFPPCHDDVA
jgi:hypothetical protein